MMIAEIDQDMIPFGHYINDLKIQEKFSRFCLVSCAGKVKHAGSLRTILPEIIDDRQESQAYCRTFGVNNTLSCVSSGFMSLPAGSLYGFPFIIRLIICYSAV